MKSLKRNGRKKAAATGLLEPIPPASKSEEISSFRLHPSSLSFWWRPILGTLLVLARLTVAILTLMANRLGVPELTSAGAIALLVFVLLLMVLVVPPLTRSAFAEVAATG